MRVAAISQKPTAAAGGWFADAPPPHAAGPPRSCRRLAAGTAAASLLAHGGFLLAIALLDPYPISPGAGRVIPVELVIEPAVPEKMQVAAGAREISPAPREAMQNPPGGMGAALLQQTSSGQASKPGEKPPSGLNLGIKPAAPPASANRASGAASSTSHKDIAGQETTPGLGQVATAPRRVGNRLGAGGARAPHFDSGPDRFRAAAVPLPAERGGEAMSYRSIVGGKLERVKHYPGRPLQRAKGIATVGFVLDKSGGVAAVVLLRSSGEADLDAESLALVNRAAPFPAPPPGAPKSFAIEVAFGLGH
jgi:TonB family protein